MKKLLLITLLFLAFGANAQTTKKIDSFLGIKFGSTSAAVIAAMKQKGYALDKELTKATVLYFDGVKLGTRKTSYFAVKIVDDKAYTAIFFFTPELEAKMIDEYDALVKDVNEVYGDGRSSKRFKSPFKDGDGDEILAITSGHAEYDTYWIDGANGIMAQITSKGNIMLTYQDGPLNDIANGKQKEKNKADY